MKKTFLLLTILSLSFGLFAQQSTKKTTIVGQIQGLDNDTLIIFSSSLLSSIEDTSGSKQDIIITQGNRFEYEVSDNTMIHILVKRTAFKRKNNAPLFSESNMIRLVTDLDDTIKISGQSESGYINYSVSGEGFNSDYARFRQKYKSSSMQVDSMTQKLEVLYKQPQSAETQSMIAKLKTQRTENRKFQNEMKMNFITSNFDTDLSAYLLISMGPGILESFYPQLSINVKNGVFSTYMNKILDELRMTTDNKSKVQVGKLAPNFTLKNQTGEDVTLSSLKGKYIVLDFWGTWCPPCMRGMSKMKDYYNKYKDNVEFVGIACDEKEATWKAAINKNDLNWRQLINDDKKTENDVSIRYAIQAFPTKIIIDKDMTILAVFRGETKHFYDKLDELMKQ